MAEETGGEVGRIESVQYTAAGGGHVLASVPRLSVFGAECCAMLREQGGANFVELRTQHDDGTEYAITVQRVDGETPSQQRDDARAELVDARLGASLRIAQLEQEVELLTAALVLITRWRGDLIDHEAGARNPREIAQDALAPDPSGEDVASGGDTDGPCPTCGVLATRADGCGCESGESEASR